MLPYLKMKLRSTEAIELFNSYSFVENIMKRDKSDHWKRVNMLGFCEAFTDDFKAPKALGFLTVKSDEVHPLDSDTVIVDKRFNIIKTSSGPRSRAVIKCEGDEPFIFVSGLLNRMLKILFPTSYIHSMTPDAMHTLYEKTVNTLY